MKLKQCPLCGKPPRRQELVFEDRTVFQVICSGPEGSEPWHAVMTEGYTRKKADEQWNERKKP